MVSEAHRLVVILYEYPLLGEGIAKYLRAHLGVETTIASASDLEAVTAALALRPAVVIFELSDRLRLLDLAAVAPQADLIDVSMVMARGPVHSSGVAGLERLLQTVRGCITLDEDHDSMGGPGSGASAEPPDDGARDEDAGSGHRGGHREADRQGHAPDQADGGNDDRPASSATTTSALMPIAQPARSPRTPHPSGARPAHDLP